MHAARHVHSDGEKKTPRPRSPPLAFLGLGQLDYIFRAQRRLTPRAARTHRPAQESTALAAVACLRGAPGGAGVGGSEEPARPRTRTIGCVPGVCIPGGEAKPHVDVVLSINESRFKGAGAARRAARATASTPEPNAGTPRGPRAAYHTAGETQRSDPREPLHGVEYDRFQHVESRIPNPINHKMRTAYWDMACTNARSYRPNDRRASRPAPMAMHRMPAPGTSDEPNASNEPWRPHAHCRTDVNSTQTRPRRPAYFNFMAPHTVH